MRMYLQEETSLSVVFAESHVEGKPASSAMSMPKDRWEGMGSPVRIDVIVRPQRPTPIAVASVVKS